MFRPVAAALILLAPAAHAEDCDALFALEGNPDVPVVIEATQSFNGRPRRSRGISG